MTRTLFCFGLGYVAERLAQRLMEEGWRVAGTCRTPEKQAALRGRGIEAHLFDIGRPLEAAGAALAGVTHILASIPPKEGTDPVLGAHDTDLRALQGLEWVGYLSTTGVYGEKDGGWVDEASPLNPSTPNGKARVAAEAQWRAAGLPLHIFRLSGIYGPGRSAIEQVRAG
ncbi:MAG: SDR family NAD(P)-dependent oxidoreductase, partial [Alphaproteobacteria bacterium]|nr:SDR family NAD(P)-dependent oxidoreductase [Alphaproteobacteria bacterium]